MWPSFLNGMPLIASGFLTLAQLEHSAHRPIIVVNDGNIGDACAPPLCHWVWKSCSYLLLMSTVRSSWVGVPMMDPIKTPSMLSLLHSKFAGADCNRQLSSPQAIHSGIMPLQKALAEQATARLLHFHKSVIVEVPAASCPATTIPFSWKVLWQSFLPSSIPPRRHQCSSEATHAEHKPQSPPPLQPTKFAIQPASWHFFSKGMPLTRQVGGDFTKFQVLIKSRMKTSVYPNPSNILHQRGKWYCIEWHYSCCLGCELGPFRKPKSLTPFAEWWTLPASYTVMAVFLLRRRFCDSPFLVQYPTRH